MKSKLRHILAANIRNRRNALGLSQAKLAEIAGIAPGYLAMIELKKNFPSDEVLERIALALQVDPTELFSQSCYPVEAVRTLKKSVLEDIDQAIKMQLAKLESGMHGATKH